MRIVYARNLYRPIDFGGNRYALEVTRRLAERGHEVVVVTGRFPNGPGVPPVSFVKYPFSSANPLATFSSHTVSGGLSLRRALRQKQFDVIVLASYDVAYGAWLFRAAGATPTVYVYHSRFVSDAVDRLATLSWPLRLVHRPVSRFVDHVQRVVLSDAERVIAVSEFSREEVAMLGSREHNVSVIPTGVDVDAFGPGDRMEARSRLGLGREEIVLVTVGRLAPVKRYDRAIEVIRHLNRRTSLSVKLLIIGDGPERARLEQAAARLDVTGLVRFEGFQTGGDLVDRLRAANFMLCTSDFENWSLAVLEGLACGLPVITTPFGGTPQMLTPIAPELVLQSADAVAFADRILDLLAWPSAVARIGDAARKHAEQFGWDAVVTRLEDELRSAATSH